MRLQNTIALGMLLYYITDRNGFVGSDTQQREALLRRIADAACAGVDYIQLREKDLSSREMERLAAEALRAVRDHSSTTRLLINGRADVALAVGADGVHLPSGQLTVLEIRALWTQCRGGPPLIGVSAHTTAEVRDAEVEGADFAVLAPIFEKAQTGKAGIGLEALRAVCSRPQLLSNPADRVAVLALGGVTPSNALACLAAGAAGVAGIRIFQWGDVFETVKRLRGLGGPAASCADCSKTP